MRTRSKELQEAYDEYDRIQRNIESSMNNFFDNPTKEGYEKLSKYLSEQAAPDYSKVEKLIDKWKGLQ